MPGTQWHPTSMKKTRQKQEYSFSQILQVHYTAKIYIYVLNIMCIYLCIKPDTAKASNSVSKLREIQRFQETQTKLEFQFSF